MQRNPLLGNGFRVVMACLSAALIAVVLPMQDSHADRADRMALGRLSSPLLLEVQTALAQLGFYNGSVDGQFTIETGHSIRRYRQTHRLPDTGHDWQPLMEHLNAQVRQGRGVKSGLDRARNNQIAAARSLLDEGLEIQQRLQDVPSREAGKVEVYECFVLPTADCLFASALQAVDKIEREEYRNWALRDLIREQALSDRVDAAFAGLKKLSDPRLIFVALREITEGLAESDRIEQALETARLIPEPNQRAKAITVVVDAMLTQRKFLEARGLGSEIETLLGRQRNVIERILLMASLAEKFVMAGDRGYGAELLERAVGDLAGVLDGPARDASWATIAKVRLALGDTEAASRAMGRIEDETTRVMAVTADAAEKARLSKSKYALRITASIGGLRYRTLALTEVAQGRHQLGDLKGARDMLGRAERLVSEIDSPYAGSFSLARIAATYAKLGLFEPAVRVVGEIDDDDLRARLYWNVSRQLRENDRTGEALVLEAKALDVASKAKSTFDRTSLLGNFAIDLARDERLVLGRDVFERAMRESRKIKTGWWRVRALARLARVLYVIERNGHI
jgi:hypothetical protein